MKILGFIPARGGSKSIPLKNLYNINNKPLIYYTLKNAIDSKIFYKIIVSSDNNKILDYSGKFKKIDLVKRPKNISGNSSLTEEALEHALKSLKKNLPDYICIIEPTAPLRSIKTLKKLKKFLKRKKIISLITTNKIDHIPGKINNNTYNYLEYNRKPRQQRKPYYLETGTFYVVNYNYFIKSKRIVCIKPYAFNVPKIESMDINDLEDLKIAEALIKNLK